MQVESGLVAQLPVLKLGLVLGTGLVAALFELVKALVKVKRSDVARSVKVKQKVMTPVKPMEMVLISYIPAQATQMVAG